jgi:hypothetical protein
MSQLLSERRSGTAPERWEPLRELDQVTERMRQMLEQTFGGIGWSSPLLEREGWSPFVDLEETDDAYVVEAELPGVNARTPTSSSSVTSSTSAVRSRSASATTGSAFPTTSMQTRSRQSSPRAFSPSACRSQSAHSDGGSR